MQEDQAPLVAERIAALIGEPARANMLQALMGGQALTAGEFDLLLVLVERAGRVLSRDQLLDLTRGREAAPFDRSVDVQISRLRRKIEQDPKNPKVIKTVRGGGYTLASKVDRS